MGGRGLIERAFAGAPFAEDGWLKALHCMAEATGSSRGQLLFMGERHVGLNCVTNVSDDYYADFVAIEGHRQDVNWRIGAGGAPFEIIHEDHYDAARLRHTDERYLDHVRRFDAEDGAQTILAAGNSGLFGFATLRTRGDGRTDEASREMFAFAAEHALAAVRTQLALEDQGIELLRGSLEALRVAAVLIDGYGRVCAVTPAAERILSNGPFRLERSQLMTSVRHDDAALQARIGRALRGDISPAPDFWTRISGMPCLVEINPLPRHEWSFGFRPRMIVTFRFPIPVGRGDAGRLAEALPLTPAEAEVVALAAAGLPRTGIAAARGTSVETVSAQLRAIFAKCDVRREAELVSLAIRLLAPR